MKIQKYNHSLEEGSNLTAYSIDPEIGKSELKQCVENSLLETKRKEPANLVELSQSIRKIGEYQTFSEMQPKFSFDKYNVPQKLHDFRDVFQLGFSDSIIIFKDGNISTPSKFIKGEYRDFVSTHLKRIPSDLVPESYPQGKTIAQLLPEWGLTKKDIANYFGFAHFLTPSNGEEFSFVYRGENLHIAPNCMSVSGSTPTFPDRFNHEGFDIDTYLKSHLADEMMEEYCLNPEEFEIGKIHFMDDQNEIPFAAIEIKTPLSTEELAVRAYDQPQPKEEHSIFFGIDRNNIGSLLNNFDVFPSTARIADLCKSKII